LVYKLAAALSEQGADLDAVEDVAKYAISRLGTLGVGLDHCHVPGTKAGESHLAADQVELVNGLFRPYRSEKANQQGMGIHNEPGTHKLSLPKTADLVNEMLTRITDTNDKERSFVPFKNDGSDEVVLLVNNLGSISELEFGGITNEGE